jgi:CubicO group peptidase (beta-lactamase class C family)
MTSAFDDKGLARFDDVAAAHVGDDKVPGLVALVSRHDVVHATVLGSQSIGGPPMRRDTLFRISSNTKPVTAVAVLALVEEGRLGLDDPVDRLLPELARPRVLRRMDAPLDDTEPAARPITVRDLLTFTFGFGMSAEMFTASEPWPIVAATEERNLHTLGPPNPDAIADPDTWMAALGSLPLMAQPGERWLYNTSAQVLGVLVARAAGESFAEVLRTRVFGPLGMADTAFSARDTGRLATSYQPTPDGLTVWDPPDGQWNHPPRFEDGAAGLVSTVDDLLALARMLLGGGSPVLSVRLVSEMTTDHLTAAQRGQAGAFLSGEGWGFCQSVVVDGERRGAYGWAGGLGTSWLVDPVRDLTVIVMTQRMFESAPTPGLHLELQAAAYDAVAGR